MSRRRNRGLPASWLLASPLALVLLALAVGGAAAHHAGHLSDPTVSPCQVAAGTPVAFAVTYADAGGTAPRAVTVEIDRTTEPMSAASDAFAEGVRYAVSYAPSVGWHMIRFAATDSAGNQESVWAGYVLVKGESAPGSGSSASPKPTASPKPDPSKSGAPGPTPVANSGGDGRSRAGGGEPGPSGAASTPGSSGGSASSSSGASPAPGEPGAQGGSGERTPAPSKTPAPGAAATGNPGSHGGSGTKWGGAGANPDPSIPGQAAEPAASRDIAGSGNVLGRAIEETRGSIAAGVPPVRTDLMDPYRRASLSTLLIELAPTIATAGAGGAAWAAFVIFGKRRDGDDLEPESVLATSAATGVETGAAEGLRVVDESLLPRWRRPSLQQVRKADPLRAVAEAPTLSFSTAGVRPLDRYERRQIRYRLVRLLDCPDEVRAAEIGILDRGDEVQLLERQGLYWRVLCPDGRQGWVHRMTLAEPVVDSTPEIQEAIAPSFEPEFEPAPEIAEAAIAVEPDENVDGLLGAYIRARGDALRSVDKPEPVVERSPEPVEVATEPPAEPVVEPAAEPAPTVALARDHLERAGFAVQGPESVAQTISGPVVEPGPQAPADAKPEAQSRANLIAALIAQPEVGDLASIVPFDQPSSDAAPAAEPGRAGERYSERKSAGTRKASTASRPGTKSRRPSR